MTTNTGSTGSTNFNFDHIQSQFGETAANLDRTLKERIANMDPNNTRDMVEFQVEFNKYMVIEGLRSSIIKSVKDTLQSIIQKL